MRVGVLGCGYVGLALCRQLTDRGHDVVGVRRSDEGMSAVEAAGGRPIQADVTEPATLSQVPDVDALVYAASTGGRGADAARRLYVEALRASIDHFTGRDDQPERLVYTSSTGVYGDHDGDWVDEETSIEPTTEKTRVLARAEAVALSEAADYDLDGTVARFAGLYGPDRYRLERYLDGPVTQGYLNMVHRADAAGAIRHLLVTDRARGEVVLVVDDEPVAKWTFADWLADECGVDRPEKHTVAERLDAGDLSAPARRRLRTSKRCDNARLLGLGYELTHPTYREGYRAAIETFRSID